MWWLVIRRLNVYAYYVKVGGGSFLFSRFGLRQMCLFTPTITTTISAAVVLLHVFCFLPTTLTHSSDFVYYPHYITITQKCDIKGDPGNE